MSLSSDFLLYVGIIFFTRYTYISASILPLISKESKALRMVSSSSAPEKETNILICDLNKQTPKKHPKPC